MTKPLKDYSKEVQHENFLEETPNIPLEQKVVVSAEVPKYEKIIFQNNRDPGVAVEFHYSSKTHPTKQYTLLHGHEYTLPVEIINHLEGRNPWDNYACHERIYGRRMNAETGRPDVVVNSYRPCFYCKPVR